MSPQVSRGSPQLSACAPTLLPGPQSQGQERGVGMTWHSRCRAGETAMSKSLLKMGGWIIAPFRAVAAT